MFCTNCGVQFTGNFCPNCGAPVQASPPPPAELAPEEPRVTHRCSKCGSYSLRYGKRGFRWGRALAWGLFTGGIGLVAGFVGSNEDTLTCLGCGHKESLKNVLIREKQERGIPCCPKCGSTHISTNKAGFSVGKAAAGGFLAGPIGLAAGSLGSKKVTITCLSCGHRWRP